MKKIGLAFLALITLYAVGNYLFKAYKNMDIILNEYSNISEITEKGWIPTAFQDLNEASEIKMKADLDINQAFIKFHYPAKSFPKLLSKLRSFAESVESISCLNSNDFRCSFFENGTKSIQFYKLKHEDDESGLDVSYWLVSEVKEEVVYGSHYPFDERLVFK